MTRSQLNAIMDSWIPGPSLSPLSPASRRGEPSVAHLFPAGPGFWERRSQLLRALLTNRTGRSSHNPNILKNFRFSPLPIVGAPGRAPQAHQPRTAPRSTLSTSGDPGRVALVACHQCLSQADGSKPGTPQRPIGRVDRNRNLWFRRPETSARRGVGAQEHWWHATSATRQPPRRVPDRSRRSPLAAFSVHETDRDNFAQTQNGQSLPSQPSRNFQRTAGAPARAPEAHQPHNVPRSARSTACLTKRTHSPRSGSGIIARACDETIPSATQTASANPFPTNTFRHLARLCPQRTARAPDGAPQCIEPSPSF